MATSFSHISRIAHACLSRASAYTPTNFQALALPVQKVAQAQSTTAWFAFAAGTASAAAMAATVTSTTSCDATVPSSPPPAPVVAAPAPPAPATARTFRPAPCPVEAPAGQAFTEVDIAGHRETQRGRGHLIYETLWGEGKLEQYRVWFTEDKQTMVAQLLPGSNVVGHPGITHGGCTAAVADNLLGTLFFVSSKGTTGFTANLTINYRSPWMANTPAVFVSRVVKVEGRKYFLEGDFKHMDGKTVIANTTALFIVPRARSPPAAPSTAEQVAASPAADSASTNDAPADSSDAPAATGGATPTRSERK